MKIGNDKYLGVLSPQPTRLLTSGFSYPNSNFGFFLTPDNTACSFRGFSHPNQNSPLTSGFSHPRSNLCCCFFTPAKTACSPHLGFFSPHQKTACSPRGFLTPTNKACSPHLTSLFFHPGRHGLLTSPRFCLFFVFSPRPTRPAHLTSGVFLCVFSTKAKTARSPRVSVTQPTRPAHLTSGFFSPRPTRPAHLGFADIGGRHAGVGAGIETQRLGFEPADGGVRVVEHATAEANRLPLRHRHVLRTLHLQGPNPH